MSEYKLDRELNARLRKTKMTDNTSIRKFFTSMSRNIITPTLNSVGSRKGGKFIYEITDGTDMSGKPIQGLSVYRWNIDLGEYERCSSDDTDTLIVGIHRSSKSVNRALKLLGEL